MLALYRCGPPGGGARGLPAARAARWSTSSGSSPAARCASCSGRSCAQDPALDAGPRAARRRRPRRAARGCSWAASASWPSSTAALDDALAGRGRRRAARRRARHRQEPARRGADRPGAQARGARVLVGRCWEAGGAPAYWPWVQSLRAYVRETEPGRAARAARGGRGATSPSCCPSCASSFPDLPEPAGAGVGGRALPPVRGRRAPFLRSAARAEPLVLVLDDLHAADEPSLLLLRFVAREIADSRLLVVVRVPRRRPDAAATR